MVERWQSLLERLSPADRSRCEQALGLLQPCRLCPRTCGSPRLDGKVGYCGVGELPLVSSYGPHFGEESVLVGSAGSGTIFFAGCNLGCVFCQNYTISHGLDGEPASIEQVVAIMLQLQRAGCHNINFVTPTHIAPQLLVASLLARAAGLGVPIVFNCGGYESVQMLKLLEGVIDIYMPDFKYSRVDSSKRFSDAPDYPQRCLEAVREMHRQVGDLVTDARGLAIRGLLVRHLVLPGDVAGSLTVMDLLADEISSNTFVNVMGQYRPCYKADRYVSLSRRVTADEVRRVAEYARKRGLRLSD